MRCSLRSRPSSRSNTSLRRRVASRMPRPNTSAPARVIGARPRVMRYPPSAHSPQPVHAVARVRSSSTRELDRVRICTEPNQSSTRKAYLELSRAQLSRLARAVSTIRHRADPAAGAAARWTADAALAALDLAATLAMAAATATSRPAPSLAQMLAVGAERDLAAAAAARRCEEAHRRVAAGTAVAAALEVGRAGHRTFAGSSSPSAASPASLAGRAVAVALAPRLR